MNIVDSEHFLYIAKQNNHEYYKQFEKMIKLLELKIDRESLNSLIENDLQISKPFIKKQYLQFAVESTINYFFARNFDEFIYEKQSDISSKDVDCQISYKNFEFNIEVKCPEIIEQGEKVIYGQIGHRTDRYEEMLNKMNDIKSLTKGNFDFKLPIEVGGASSKDLTLYTYLCDLHKKVGSNNENKVNILFVSLYNKHNFSEWYRYLMLPEGLFTKTSFKEKRDYENVDIVVFTSTINSHANYEITNINSWKLEDQFNFMIINPHSKYKKEKGIKIFEREILKNKHRIEFLKLIDEIIDKAYKLSDEELKKRIVKALAEMSKTRYPITEVFFISLNFTKIKQLYGIFKEEEKVNGSPFYTNEQSTLEYFFALTTYINRVEEIEGKKYFQMESLYMYQKMI